MTNALLAIAVMAAVVFLSWFVQGVRQRNHRGSTSGQDGSAGGDTTGESHGGFGGHGHSGDHGTTSDAGGSGGGSGADGGSGDGGGGGSGD